MAYQGGDPSPQIAALLSQLGPAGGGDPSGGAPAPDDSGGGASDPLSAVQSCIQDLHGLAGVVKDPENTQAVVQALGILTKVQTSLMNAQKGAQFQ